MAHFCFCALSTRRGVAAVTRKTVPESAFLQ
jgi:hypothetical protein